MTKKVTRSDWIRHGLRVLERDGHGGLKADRMVKELDVTRGSFYWHFETLSAFQTALLETWRETHTEAIIEELSVLPHNTDRLRILLAGAMSATHRIEAAMRGWALANDGVATAIADVDAVRIAYLTDLLVAEGIPEDIAQHRAIVLAWAAAGHAMAPTFANTLSDQSAADISAIFLTNP